MVQEMEFMGIEFTSEGLKIHESTVKAITAAKTSINKQVLRIWLGLPNSVKFQPKLCNDHKISMGSH